MCKHCGCMLNTVTFAYYVSQVALRKLTSTPDQKQEINLCGLREFLATSCMQPDMNHAIQSGCRILNSVLRLVHITDAVAQKPVIAFLSYLGIRLLTQWNHHHSNRLPGALSEVCQIMWEAAGSLEAVGCSTRSTMKPP